MSYVEQGIGKRFGSLTTFLLQLDPTCFLENKQKKSSSMFFFIFKQIIHFFILDDKYNMFATAYHPSKYLLNPMTRNMRKKKNLVFDNRMLF